MWQSGKRPGTTKVVGDVALVASRLIGETFPKSKNVLHPDFKKQQKSKDFSFELVIRKNKNAPVQPNSYF